jgi:glycosyltransferase involved in cell wall biosynthesis
MPEIAILHLMNAVGDSSIGRIVQRLVRYSDDQRYSWHVGGLRKPDTRLEFGDVGAQVVDFSDRTNGSTNLGGRIREYVANHQVKIVHTHSPLTTLKVAGALAGARETLHLATVHLLYAPGDRRWGLVYALLQRFTLYLPDHLVPVSRRMGRQIAAYPGMKASRVTAIQNAIDCESFYLPDQRDDCRSEFGLAPESLVIGYMGRIEKMKRLDLLLHAFVPVLARHPQARLMIIGEGKLNTELDAIAARLGVSHAVIWTGFRQDIARLLAAMDVYVQPSTNEGLSLSILEAMAAGKPVIATDVGAAREVITDRQTGILVRSGSTSAISAAIMELLNHPQKRSALAQAGRNRVVRQFGVQQMVDGYLRVYNALASRL